jgi:hypothetical protein
MLKSLARGRVRSFSSRYGYDAAYMEAMLDTSPAAFFKVARIIDLAQHRESAPLEAYYAAKLIGALTEDCGPCTQLVVNMAVEAGVARAQIEAVLRRDVAAMSDDTVLAFRFAEAIVARGADEDDWRNAVRTAWGDKGVLDLTLSLQVGRIFPMIKAGLGYAKECRRVTVDGRAVDVVKRAA